MSHNFTDRKQLSFRRSLIFFDEEGCCFFEQPNSEESCWLEDHSATNKVRVVRLEFEVMLFSALTFGRGYEFAGK